MNHFLRFLLAALLCPALLLLSPAVRAQTLAFDQAVACASGDSYSFWGPSNLVMDAQGNTYVTGTFNQTIVLGSTVLTATQTPSGNLFPSDNFIAKLDAAGNYLWAVQLGDNQRASISALAVDGAGNVYIAGAFSSFNLTLGATGPRLFNSSARSEAFVAKLDGTTRQWLWARRAGGTGTDNLNVLTLNAAGELYVAGNSESPVADYGPFTLTASTAPAPGARVGTVLAKLTPSGTWLWARMVGAGEELSIGKVVPDAQGNIYLGGNFQSPSVSFGSTVLSTLRVVGTPFLYGSDVFFAKTNDAGTWAWAVQGDAVAHQNMAGGGITYDGAGHFYVGGSYESTSARIGATVLPNLSGMRPLPIGPAPPQPYTNNYYDDAFVARFDLTTATWDWAVRNGGPANEYATAPLVDAQGRAYVLGEFVNPALNGNAQLAQMDAATGAWRSVQSLGPIGVLAVTLDGQGRLHLGGFFHTATATFGPVTLVQAAPGYGTGYVARLGAGPLAAQAGTLPAAGLTVWPNPSGHGPVWVQGPAPGQAVQVLDALGRLVGRGHMPASGPLALGLPPTLPPGLYLVRSAGLTRRLVVE